MTEVNHYEATVLSLIERMQPVTAYQVRMQLARSPTSGISNSAGKIYPIVRRLAERGLLHTEVVQNDRRNTELLRCTTAGKQALRHWVLTFDDAHRLPEDPLRTKVLSFALLSPAEQRRWLQRARDDLAATQRQLSEFAAKHPGMAEDLAHANAKLITAARIAWIDLALKKLAAPRLATEATRPDRRPSRRR